MIGFLKMEIGGELFGVPAKIKEIDSIPTGMWYGSRRPTRYMVKYKNRWRRVYCCIYSNVGTCFIGKSLRDGIIVEDITSNLM